MRIRRVLIFIFLVTAALIKVAAQRSVIQLHDGWRFAFGNAADPQKDFGCGTEYFNYLTKANSIHNEGPYKEPVSGKDKKNFDDSTWLSVTVPHDFVTLLDFSSEASHSHGYKTVGYKFPETSVGWYRYHFNINSPTDGILNINDDDGSHYELRFDGIFRDSRVWVNGFYCGGERSGYLSQQYDITDYLNLHGENVICVRADATLEEGWFYEGGGIYRNAYIIKTAPVHLAPDAISITTHFNNGDYTNADVHINAAVKNSSHVNQTYSIRYSLLNAQGELINSVNSNLSTSNKTELSPMATQVDNKATLRIASPKLWSTDTPYLYIAVIDVLVDGKVVDTQRVKFGVRELNFDKDRGLIFNGKPLKIKGVNMHQDHAGVGSAIPFGLNVYRIEKLKAMGCNAYRSSHNPMTPELLNICDSLGMLVIDENRLSGISEYEISALKRMIDRDRNHPSIILWSCGNEEWGIEWSEKGEKIAATMRDYSHIFDPSREMTFATSGGPTVEVPVDVAGYNYIMQNPIEEHRQKYPERKCYGSEETTACGTRGVYYADAEGRWMPSMNRTDTTYENIIERGWKFYKERPWAAGCFFWTGFDYRGEPNPLGYPAVGAEFGILDYCGFPKDEAYYLKAAWTDETVLHIFPHWNLKGHEGEKVSLWAYSNCDEIELFVNGKSLGKQQMPVDGHLTWDAVYQPGKVRAVGYKNAKKVTEVVNETTGDAVKADMTYTTHDNITVVDILLKDKKGRVVPTACNELRVKAVGDAEIIGAGNGDPAYKGKDNAGVVGCKEFSVPAFNGCAQVILRAQGEGRIEVTMY